MIESSTNWQTGTAGDELNHLLRAVIQKLNPIAGDITMEKFRGGRTNLIKRQLISLGYETGNCVYGNLKRKSSIVPDPTVDLHNANIDSFIGFMDLYLSEQKRIDSKRFGDHTFKNQEWLYDIHWYKDQPGKDYMPCSLPLVAEIELGKQRETMDTQSKQVEFSAVKFDFQKLLVSNADNMVMIFTCTKFDYYVKREGGLDDYFMQTLQYYRNIQNQKADFLLICYSKGLMYWKGVNCK